MGSSTSALSSFLDSLDEEETIQQTLASLIGAATRTGSQGGAEFL